MRTTLLALCGLSPQVITETLYALHLQHRMPDAIRVLTTREGKEIINSHLLAPGDGRYWQFLEEYGYQSDLIDFSFSNVKVVTDDRGSEIDDICTEEHNATFLKACMEEAFAATSAPDSAVYFSIAGGRKTMGACLTVAAQCYGRRQDRIFHVLVTPEFESNRDFYYPPRISKKIRLRDRKGEPYEKETRFAEIVLVPMPFFPIRDSLPPLMLHTPESPATLMLSLVREPKPELVIHLIEKKIIWKGIEMDMIPSRLALYAFLAQHKKDFSCDAACAGCIKCFRTPSEIAAMNKEISKMYGRIQGRRTYDYDSRSKGVGESLDEDNVRSYRTRINSDIAQSFGNLDRGLLEIASDGDRPPRYGIRLGKEQIRIVY